MITVEQISKMHNGYFHVPLYNAMGMALKEFPDLYDVLCDCPIDNFRSLDDWVVDVKIHMLMPDQWPCIPNWHYDMVPRDENGEQDFSKVDTEKKMYLWVSGAPLTEFEDGREVIPQEWLEFTQMDLHRGTVCTEHTWRMFVRVAPKELVPPAPQEQWVRRHSQVYLDANSFRW